MEKYILMTQLRGDIAVFMQAIPSLLFGSFLFLFPYRISKRTDSFSKLEIFAVGEGGKVGTAEVQASLLVYQRLVHSRGDDVGDEHIVRALRNDLAELAFERQRRLCDRGRGDLEAFFGRQFAFFELIDLSSRQHTAGIGSADEVHGHQIDAEFARFLDDLIRMARGSHRDIERGRMCRDDAAPSDGDRVRLFALTGGGDYDSRQRREESAAFPFLL